MKKTILVLWIMICLVLSAIGAVAECKSVDNGLFKLVIDSNELHRNYGQPITLQQGQDVEVDVYVENFGIGRSQTHTRRVECGIYKESTVMSWGLLSIVKKEVPNCESSETNVDTVEITLDPNGKSLHTFHLTAPQTNPDDKYVLMCDAYVNCYRENCPDGTGVNSDIIDWERVDLEGSSTLESCSDGIQNQDETDTDCGGVCKDCAVNYKCVKDSDCQTKNCELGLCKEKASNGTGGLKIPYIGLLLLVISGVALLIFKHPYIMFAVILSAIYTILQLVGVL